MFKTPSITQNHRFKFTKHRTTKEAHFILVCTANWLILYLETLYNWMDCMDQSLDWAMMSLWVNMLWLCYDYNSYLLLLLVPKIQKGCRETVFHFTRSFMYWVHSYIDILVHILILSIHIWCGVPHDIIPSSLLCK